MSVAFTPGQMLRTTAECPNFGPRTRHKLAQVPKDTVGEYVYTTTRSGVGEVVMIRLRDPRHTVLVRASVLEPCDTARGGAAADPSS